MTHTVRIVPEGADASQTIRAAVRECHRQNADVLSFLPGTYHFKDDAAIKDFQAVFSGQLDPNTPWGWDGFPYHAALEFDACDGLVIDGQGATLIFHGLIQPFAFRNCRQVTLKNLTIDWARVPYSVGRILSVAGETVEVEIFPEYPVSGGEPVWCLNDRDPVSGHIGAVWTFGSSSPLEKIGPQTVRFTDSHAPHLTPGHELVMQHTGPYRPGIHILDCADVRLEDIVLHAVPGYGVIGHRSQDITVRRLQVRPGPGKVRSVNRDATHFISCRGRIDFEDCYFEGMGDDAINVHGFYYAPQERLDDRTVSAVIEAHTQDRVPECPEIGDTMEFVRRDTLLPYAVGQVAQAHVDPRTRQVEIAFAAPLPETFVLGDILADTTQVPSLRFVNCTVRDNCARGVLIQTRDVLIEGCTFDHCTGTGIDINTAQQWFESIGTRAVTVRGNRFIGCGYGLGGCRDASGISVRTECVTPAIGVHRDLVIEDNVIEGTDRIGISVGCAEGVVVRNNQITRSQIGIRLEYVRHVTLANNSGGENPILLDAGCALATIVLR